MFAKGILVLTLAEAAHHFAHLFVRAFVCSYSFLGTSPGGLAAQVLTIFTTEVQGGWWRLSAWRANWQGGLKRAVYTLLVVWAVTFAVCTATTIYNDHQNISGRWRAVVREKDELKNSLSIRDKYIQQLTEENSRLRAAHTPKANTSAPTTINAPGGIPIVGNKGTVNQPTVNNNFGPPAPKITWEQAPNYPQPTGYARPVVFAKMYLDSPMNNPKFKVVCDRPCMGTNMGGLPMGAVQPYYTNLSDNVVVFATDPPNPLPGDRFYYWGVQSKDDSPVHITDVSIVLPSKP